MIAEARIMPGRGKQLEGELSKKDSKYSSKNNIIVCKCGTKMTEVHEKNRGYCGLCKAKKDFFG